MSQENKQKRQHGGGQSIVSPDDSGLEAWLGVQTEASTPETTPEEAFATLRPSCFDDYIGQEQVKENLRIACQAAQQRGEALDHVLLHGPPGLGKTSLAQIISKELGVGLKTTAGPVIERPGDLAAILTSLQAHDVLFVDEIHRLPRVVEEILYPAMEDFSIDIVLGQGPAAKSIKLSLKPFTLVGATTRTSLLTSPLRDRFGMVFRLDFYKPQDLTRIIQRSAGILGVSIEPEAADEIGARSRGTPRIANRLLKRVRDYAQHLGKKVISVAETQIALKMLEIDRKGLEKMDRLILETVITKFSGGPVGIDTIAAAVGEDKDTIEDVYEPFLVQQGFLVRSKRGREASLQAYEHLGLEQPKQTRNLNLF